VETAEHHVTDPHRVSVVVPVYRGEHTLSALVEELVALQAEQLTPDGHRVAVTEVLLVHDHGPDDSARVIRELAAKHDFLHPVWLSRNFGQHAATMAGMAASTGDWVLTIDEDGQHDPAYVAAMLDVAMAKQTSAVYAEPTNSPPHGFVRNVLSKNAKRVVDILVGGQGASVFHSFRLVMGDTARRVAEYSGTGVYLDIALGWVATPPATCPVELRQEAGRPSGYNLRSLMSHFWRMVLTSGTRLLRFVGMLGIAVALLGAVAAVLLVVSRLTGAEIVRGWTSTVVIFLLGIGAVLFALGIVAEYVGVAVNMAMGKPRYVVVDDPANSPLGRLPEIR
jgi:undecaprenyl-phosphate 4-deoxy-4-formamido-L-arabinose transferase